MGDSRSTLSKAIASALIASALTAASYGLGLRMKWILAVNWLEVFSVWTSYSCTYLCVVQSRWNYPIGFVSVAALCELFREQALYGSMALQIWLIGAMLYGWFRWGPDDDTRPVKHIDIGWSLLGYAVLTGAVYAACALTTAKLGGAVAGWDAAILVLSIAAQFLMDNKRIENWIVWLVVDVISVVEYWDQGLKILAVQMGLFGLNALWGWWEWHRTMRPAPIVAIDMPGAP